MAEENQTEPVITVVSANRPPSPTIRGDLMHGKRFTDPKTGKPASIMDIMRSAGAIETKPEEPKDDG